MALMVYNLCANLNENACVLLTNEKMPRNFPGHNKQLVLVKT